MMASTARRPSVQWNCSSVVLTTVFLVSMQLLLASSSSDAGGGGRSVVCSAAGERGKCLQSQSSRPGCAAGAEENCIRNPGDPASLYNPGYVEYRLSQNCNVSQTNDLFPAHAIARGLTVILYPIGRDKKYSLYVSWRTTNTDSNTQGFYIWTYKCSGQCWSQNRTTFPYFERDRHECQLIEDPNARSVLYNGAAHRSGLLQCKDGKGDIRPKCNSEHIMTVMVMPWPRSSAVTFSGILATSSLTFAWDNLWMDCWPTLYSTSCSSPVVVHPVEDFNVTARLGPNGGMEIHVTWSCTPGDVEYIVTVTDPRVGFAPNCTTPGSNPPCFVARNTTQVTIEGLDRNREYSISVQVMPRCNGSSFAQHYIGCRSEECCQAKRIGPIGSENSSSRSVGSSGVSIESSCVSVESSSVSVESSSVSVESSSVKSESSSTSHLQSSVKSSSVAVKASKASVPVVSSTTMVPPYVKQRETGRVGRIGTVIGVALAVVLVAFFIASATVIISYVARRRLRAGASLTSGSSLTESLETLEGGRGGGEGNGYCHLMTIDHIEGGTPSYSVTTNGTGIGGGEEMVLESSVGSASSPSTVEVGSIAGGSGGSDSEKISGVSMSLEDDDTFEGPSEGNHGGKDSKKKDEVCPNGGFSTATNDGVSTDRPGLTKRLLERARSESVRTKTARTDSRSLYRKRPRSLSSSQQPSNHLPPPSALILYSKASPDEEQKTIQHLLVRDLTQYNIRTVSEDTSTPRECPASWLEAQMREVSAVFCVCNDAFYREWYNQSDRLTSLVPVFKQLCHGLVTPSYGGNRQLLDKIAIVLPLQETDVPTYLNSRPKFFLRSENLHKMALFAKGLPEYKC